MLACTAGYQLFALLQRFLTDSTAIRFPASGKQSCQFWWFSDSPSDYKLLLNSPVAQTLKRVLILTLLMSVSLVSDP